MKKYAQWTNLAFSSHTFYLTAEFNISRALSRRNLLIDLLEINSNYIAFRIYHDG
ncbi:hypothetical protein MTYP_01906 [Methylophilaceae bacterium]|nr:hypothetical protein MTYP_01906 [Methylophilaceae bacterium]